MMAVIIKLILVHAYVLFVFIMLISFLGMLLNGPPGKSPDVETPKCLHELNELWNILMNLTEIQ